MQGNCARGTEWLAQEPTHFFAWALVFTEEAVMRCVVLCPGPSLGRLNALGLRRKLRGSVVIGVNKVVTQWRVDLWAALDPETFTMFAPRVMELAKEREAMRWGKDAVAQAKGDGRGAEGLGGLELPGVLMMDFGVDWLQGKGGEVLDQFAVTRLDELKKHCPPPGFGDYSTPAALVWAAVRGATSITVYGADMNGTMDFVGEEGGNRDANRWNQEREIFDRVAAWIRGRGIWFERVQFGACHG